MIVIIVLVREALRSEYEDIITFMDNHFVPGEPMHNMIGLAREQGFR